VSIRLEHEKRLSCFSANNKLQKNTQNDDRFCNALSALRPNQMKKSKAQMVERIQKG